MTNRLPTSTREQILESLALFDRPERERLRNFLPRTVDVEQLLRDLFAPLEQPKTR